MYSLGQVSTAEVTSHIKSIPDSNVHGSNKGPIWTDRTQVGPMLVLWTLLSGMLMRWLHCTLGYCFWGGFTTQISVVYQASVQRLCVMVVDSLREGSMLLGYLHCIWPVPLTWLHYTQSVLMKGGFIAQMVSIASQVGSLHRGPVLLRWFNYIVGQWCCNDFNTQGQCCWGGFITQHSVLLRWLHYTG